MVELIDKWNALSAEAKESLESNFPKITTLIKQLYKWTQDFLGELHKEIATLINGWNNLPPEVKEDLKINFPILSKQLYKLKMLL